MTDPIVTWQEKQIENKLSDDQLSERVVRRINKWQKKTDLIAETTQAIASTEAEIEQNADKPSGRAYREASNTLKDLQALLADTETEVAELNSHLCNDMDRLVRDAEKNKMLTERLRGAKGKTETTPATAGTSEPPASDIQPPASGTQPPESITEEMKTELHCLNYTKEDIDAMDVAMAAEIISKKKGKSATAATQQSVVGTGASSVPVMITAAMRQQLHQLRYSKEDIDAMTPADANVILDGKIAKPGTDADEPPSPSSQYAAGGAASPQQPQASVAKIKPVRTQAETDKQKKTQNAVLIGVGTVFTFVIGIFIGRNLK